MKEATNDDIVQAIGEMHDTLEEFKIAVERLGADIARAIDSLEGTVMMYSAQ